MVCFNAGHFRFSAVQWVERRGWRLRPLGYEQ